MKNLLVLALVALSSVVVGCGTSANYGTAATKFAKGRGLTNVAVGEVCGEGRKAFIIRGDNAYSLPVVLPVVGGQVSMSATTIACCTTEACDGIN